MTMAIRFRIVPCAVACMVLAAGCATATDATAPDATASGRATSVGTAPVPMQDRPAVEAAVPTATGSTDPGEPPPAGPAVLQVVDLRDGDSFVASDGVEYRIGMVNTPEVNECGAADASRATAALLSGGFTAEVYATDAYGRAVARVRSLSGVDVGYQLAASGLADGRYVERFAHEHPEYASDVRAALAIAADTRAGLHATCWASAHPSAPSPAAATPPSVVPAPAVPAGPYPNCAAARAAGAAPIHRGDPGYASTLDRDGDGVACEI